MKSYQLMKNMNSYLAYNKGLIVKNLEKSLI